MSFIPSFMKTVQYGTFSYSGAALNATLPIAVNTSFSVVEFTGQAGPDSGSSVDTLTSGTVSLSNSTNVHLLTGGKGRISWRVIEFNPLVVTFIDHYNAVQPLGSTASGNGYGGNGGGNQDFYSDYTITDRGDKALAFYRGNGGAQLCSVMTKINNTTVRFFNLLGNGPVDFSIVGVREMIPATREDFKAYCLRALGDGVLQINVSDDQVEDRIDKAIYMYQQFHMDAVVKQFIRHEITGTLMTFTGSATEFANNEQIQGLTSNTFGSVVVSNPMGYTPNAIVMYTTTTAAPTIANPPVPGGNTAFGQFLVGEEVRGTISGHTATIESFVLGDMDNKWVELPPDMIAVTRIFAPFDSRFSADILFDPQSQFNMSLMSNFTSTSIIPYYLGRSYQQLLNDTFRGRPGTRFERHQGRVYIDVNWFSTFFPGQFLIVEGMQTIDPDDFPLVWSDRWLQDYTIALVKKQWGTNLKKYTGIALPGGVTLDGKTMYDESVQEVKDLEEELKTTYQLPIDFIVG